MNAQPVLQLYYAPTSPYIRKVMAVAHVTGLVSRIECLESAAHPVQRDARIATFNPLGKIPAARTAAGEPLYDSRVICEYLDSLGQGKLFPTGERRWACLTRQALGDGMLDAAMLARYEGLVRHPKLQSEAWYKAQLEKIHAALDEIERQADILEALPLEIGTLTLGCALGYLDFRFPELDWRRDHPQAERWFAKFDHQPAMAATRPHV